MKCSKCGHQVDNNVNFCCICGNKLIDINAEVDIDNVKEYNRKKSFTALLLNIFAVSFPILFLVFTYVLSFEDGRYTLELWGDIRNTMFYSPILIGIVGFYAYFIKQPKVKRIVSFIYLYLTIISIVILILIAMGTVFFFLDYGGLLFVAPILQIISGSKFVINSKI